MLCAVKHMRPPIYKPPYDSPIEDEFARYAVKYLDETIDFSPQIEMNTICGLFRVDFLASTIDGKTIAIECDGKEFHDEYRDEWRDAMILGSGNIDEIYRIRGSDITYRLEDVFFILSIWSPHLFNERQKYNLSNVASKQISTIQIAQEETILMLSYRLEDTQELQQIKIEKRHKFIPEGKRQFWQAAFKFAKQKGGGNLDQIMNEYSKKWRT